MCCLRLPEWALPENITRKCIVGTRMAIFQCESRGAFGCMSVRTPYIDVSSLQCG